MVARTAFIKKIVVTFGLATLALGAIAVISYRSTTSLIEISNLVRRSYQVLEQTEGLQASLINVESAARDYVFSGNDAFLEPYQSALPRIPKHLKTLRALTTRNARQQQRLDELEPLISARLAAAKDSILAVKRRDTPTTKRLSGDEEGKKLMDSIRGIIFVMETEESQLLKASSEQSAYNANFAMLVTSALDAVIVVLLMWAAYATARHLTERARVEQERIRSHERLVLSQKAGRIGHFEYYYATKTCLWSAQLEALYDLAGNRFRGTIEDWLQYIHPEDRKSVQTEFERSKTTGQFEKEFRILWPNGAVRWIQMRGEVYFDSVRIPVRMVGINRDITGRKMAQTALQQSEQRHNIRNRIAEICLTTEDYEMFVRVLGVILETTGSKFGMFGHMDEHGALVVPAITPTAWERCQVTDKSMVFPRETWGESLWARAIRQKQSIYSNERATVLPKGHVEILRSAAVPVLYLGEVIGLFLVANKETNYDRSDIHVLEDVAACIASLVTARLQRDRETRLRKRMQEAMRKAHHELEARLQQRTVELKQQTARCQHIEEALLHSEERFRKAAGNIEGVLYSVDVESREFHYLSPQVEKMLGYTLEDIQQMGGRVAFLNQVIEQGDFGGQKKRWNQLKSHPVQNTGFCDEEWWRCKDGTLKCLEDRCVPVYNGNRLVTTEGVLCDITGQKKPGDRPAVRDRVAQVKPDDDES